MPKPTPTSPNAPSTFFDVTPSDSAMLQGCQWLRITGAGNLVLKGSGPSAAIITVAAVAGEWVPFGAGYVMVASTATGIQAFS